MKLYFRQSHIKLFFLYYFLISLCLLSLFFNDNFKFMPFTDNLQLGLSNSDYWPISDWRTSSPESQGMDLQKLNEMEEHISESNIKRFIDSLLIIKNGYLVYESYPSENYNKNDKHHIYSCTKVFTSALIGVALEESYINGTDDHVLDFFPNKTFSNLDSRKQAITIRDLLTMTSGLQWVDQVNYYAMAGTSDWVQYILDRPMAHEPGSVWNYNTGCSHLLSAILNQETPDGTLNYAETHIFNPLNITDYIWHTDSQAIPNGGTLLYLKPRDMAKFGFLYLNNGFWNNTQLIPSSWVAQSRTLYKEIEFDQGHGIGYGYQWWIYNWANAYTARGSYEQYIVVIPDLNLVVVSTGNADFQFINLLINYILPSTGFYLLNIIIIISLIVGLSALGAFSVFIFFRIRKRRILRKLKKEYLSDLEQEEDKI